MASPAPSFTAGALKGDPMGGLPKPDKEEADSEAKERSRLASTRGLPALRQKLPWTATAGGVAGLQQG
eukprot:6515654-Alexandrium_andersonii.AAC.1